MFDEKLEAYTIYGGRRGMGKVAFLQHLLAHRTAQLMTANNRIADLERQLLRCEIRLANKDHLYGIDCLYEALK